MSRWMDGWMDDEVHSVTKTPRQVEEVSYSLSV